MDGFCLGVAVIVVFVLSQIFCADSSREEDMKLKMSEKRREAEKGTSRRKTTRSFKAAILHGCQVTKVLDMEGDVL